MLACAEDLSACRVFSPSNPVERWAAYHCLARYWTCTSPSNTHTSPGVNVTPAELMNVRVVVPTVSSATLYDSICDLHRSVSIEKLPRYRPSNCNCGGDEPG